jgi:uncharacterized membrane protein
MYLDTVSHRHKPRARDLAMEYIVSFAVSLVVFLVIDLVWIKSVMRPIFERSVGMLMLPEPRMGAAMAFFLLYLGGLFFFAVAPAVDAQSWTIAALHGGLLGVIAYGTYETTNFSTLKGWTIKMLVIDIVWGAFLSAVVATVGFFVCSALG